MSDNEAETRYFLIDPVLKEKGYDDHAKLKLETPAPVEAIGHKGRSGRSNGIAPVTPPTPPVMRFSATAVESNSLRCQEF